MGCFGQHVQNGNVRTTFPPMFCLKAPQARPTTRGLAQTNPHILSQISSRSVKNQDIDDNDEAKNDVGDRGNRSKLTAKAEEQRKPQEPRTPQARMGTSTRSALRRANRKLVLILADLMIGRFFFRANERLIKLGHLLFLLL